MKLQTQDTDPKKIFAYQPVGRLSHNNFHYRCVSTDFAAMIKLNRRKFANTIGRRNNQLISLVAPFLL